MSLYSEFSSLLPYLQSVRKIKDYLSGLGHFQRLGKTCWPRLVTLAALWVEHVAVM